MAKKYLLTYIIDDDPIFVMLFKRILQKIDAFEAIEYFKNGQLALDSLKKMTPNNKKPDCIFLDINMPVLNGLEFLKEIKNNNSFQDVKVYMLSSSIDEKEIKKCLNYKIVHQFISKPINENDILELLR